jgi:TolB-like protein/DNA-binding winged helix-turn-helix (wHTH) protein/tetratricopeptide (TPR) repeat protein
MTEDIRFQHWRFSPDTRELFDGSQTVTLEPRVASLLEYFLAHPDELLSHDLLVEAVWEGRVVSDDAVRHAVSVLRHALAGDDHQQWIETVHKKGYISRLAASKMAASSPADTHAKSTSAEGAAPGKSRIFPHRLILMLVLLLIPVIGSYWWLQRQPPPQSDTPSVAARPYTIAVLPFAVLSGDNEPDEFTTGLAEELRGTLSRFSFFRVTSRGSSLRFPGGQVDPQEVGKQLGVRFLVEGSVRREGELLRISVALVDTHTGFRSWTDSYSATWQNLFGVQQDIATSIARALQVVLVHPGDGAMPGHTPASAEAHMQYLQGQQKMTSWVTADFDQAIIHFRRAIDLDPSYAAAYVSLADAIVKRDASTESLPMQASTKAVVKKLVDRALVLDPGLGEAYAARSNLYENTEVGAIEADLRRAIALNPSYSDAFEQLGMLLTATGRYDEAFFMIDQARSLNPLWPRHHHMKAFLHADLGQWQQARALEWEALRLEPRYSWALIGLGRIEAFQGNFAEGLRYMEQGYSLDPDNQHLAQRLAIYYLAAGDLRAAQNLLTRSATADARLYLAAFENDYRDIRDDLVNPGEVVAPNPFNLYIHMDLLLRLALAEHDPDWALRTAFSRYGLDRALQAPPDLEGYQLIQLKLALLMYLDGDREQAQQLIAALRKHMPPADSPRAGHRVVWPTIGRAIAAGVLGETDTALNALQYALSDSNPWWWWLRGHPAFDGLQGDPRYQLMVAAAEAHAAHQRTLLNEMRRAGSIPDRSKVPAVADTSGDTAGPGEALIQTRPD